MAYRMGSNPTTADLIAISIILLLLLEGTRRIYGMILPTVAIVFLLYCHFGQYFSGGLGHSGYSWKKTISYMLGYEAVFGSPMNASATMVFLFMVFGASPAQDRSSSILPCLGRAPSAAARQRLPLSPAHFSVLYPATPLQTLFRPARLPSH